MQVSKEITSDLPIPALLPRGDGHQFVVYADSCSGVAGALHETTFASVNAVIQRLQPPPEFLCFPGDEIVGLVADAASLREQWQHWFEHEMAWHDNHAMPLYHTTGNHTTYNPTSEAVYREVLSHLPSNGPAGQENLTYFVRDNDLLLIFVNTLWSGLGGEGTVETEWLGQTLAAHADAPYKFVFGHHPVFPVNGFSGNYQREIEHNNGKSFWDILVQHGVTAYFCSHILAFDVQVHQGVLQILTAGAGTAHRMPEEVEYLHLVQAAVDHEGLRYQVLDRTGDRREWLSWPPVLPPTSQWSALSAGVHPNPLLLETPDTMILVMAFTGTQQDAVIHAPMMQTLFCTWDNAVELGTLWVGIVGVEQRLVAKLSQQVGRSPHTWVGPSISLDKPFAFQMALHTGMGAGGILWRLNENEPWTSLLGASFWGAERIHWGKCWSIGHGQAGASDLPFISHGVSLQWHMQSASLQHC